MPEANPLNSHGRQMTDWMLFLTRWYTGNFGPVVGGRRLNVAAISQAHCRERDDGIRNHFR